MNTRLGIIIGCIMFFLFVAVQPASANHLCGQDCNQFTDQGACTHGCTVPGSNPNPDYRSDDSYRNEQTQQAQQNAAASNEATAAIVIQQAVAAGVEANIAKQVLETQYGVTNAAAALEAVKQLNAAADAAIASGTVQTGCQGAGCCLVGNCGSGQYCAGADAGRNQYGRCVEGDNKPRSGTTIAAAFIAAGGSAAAVTNNPLAFLGETDYDKMQGKNGQTVTSLESILNGIKGVTTAPTLAPGNTTTQANTLPDAWKMSVGGKCDESSNLKCGDASKGTGFCVPDGVGGTKTCNDYFLQFGFNVQTGGYSLVLPFLPSECNQIKSPQVWQCLNSDYSVCTKYTSNSYKCYLKGNPTPSSFTISEDNQCLTSKLSGAIIAGYYCQGIDNVGKTNGCQNPVSGYSDGSKSKICVSDIARNICGVVQIDAKGNHPDGTQEDYSINVFSSAGCRTVIPPTTTVFVPPQDIPPCTTNCGGETPPPSTPPQSPPPPGSPVCLGETSSISAPTLGQSPVFTCTPASQTTRYEFQWKLGNGAYQSLAPNATGSNVSVPLLVNSSGTHTIQCRPCNANGCANFDNI